MRSSSAGVSVLASCPACLLNSPASRSSRNRLLQRSINASLQSSLSRIAAQVWSASSSNISRARRASSARPLRLAARWLSSIRSASVSTMVFSMNTIILPFQLLQYTSVEGKSFLLILCLDNYMANQNWLVLKSVDLIFEKLHQHRRVRLRLQHVRLPSERAVLRVRQYARERSV